MWEELLDSAGWKALERLLREEQADLLRRLIALASESTDAAVRGAAMQVRSIDDFLGKPEQEAEGERSGE